MSRLQIARPLVVVVRNNRCKRAVRPIPEKPDRFPPADPPSVGERSKSPKACSQPYPLELLHHPQCGPDTKDRFPSAQFPFGEASLNPQFASRFREHRKACADNCPTLCSPEPTPEMVQLGIRVIHIKDESSLEFCINSMACPTSQSIKRRAESELLSPDNHGRLLFLRSVGDFRGLGDARLRLPRFVGMRGDFHFIPGLGEEIEGPRSGKREGVHGAAVLAFFGFFPGRVIRLLRGRRSGGNGWTRRSGGRVRASVRSGVTGRGSHCSFRRDGLSLVKRADGRLRPSGRPAETSAADGLPGTSQSSLM